MLGFEPSGRRFESCRVYQEKTPLLQWSFFLVISDRSNLRLEFSARKYHKSHGSAECSAARKARSIFLASKWRSVAISCYFWCETPSHVCRKCISFTLYIYPSIWYSFTSKYGPVAQLPVRGACRREMSLSTRCSNHFSDDASRRI